jgi:ornithine cyclodeaminase/alanine dehydrogenase-like protein (mu-crystallin family)
LSYASARADGHAIAKWNNNSFHALDKLRRNWDERFAPSLAPTTRFLTPSSPVVTLPTPVDYANPSPKADMTPHGALTIMSNEGNATGFLNAEEVTAFRTALCSSLLFCRRQHFKHLVVFGAGRQAFWHIRLALLLRGPSLKTVNIINRTFSDRARDLLGAFYSIGQATKEHEGWTNVTFSILTPSYGEYARLLKDQLRGADAIITTVPSTAPLFDATILTSTEGKKRGRLIIAIGSYKPHMIEIPVEIIHQAVKPQHEHRHFHKHAVEGGVVIVDTLTGCLKEAGEIIQAALSPHQLVEVGEIVMLEGQLAGSPVDLDDVELA